MGQSPHKTMDDITFTVEGIEKLLRGINAKKATGPDEVPSRILKECASEIAPIFRIIFQQSWSTGEVPADWRCANVTAIFKKGDRTTPANYRPVSLTSVPCKLMEHIIFSNVMSHCDEHEILKHYQHGFRRKHSCESQLIITLEELQRQLDNNIQSDVLILDFSKAFDKVDHHRLTLKLDFYGVRGCTNKWITNWLAERTQTVVLGGKRSAEASVTSGVPQGTVLGPLLFLMYVNDIGEGVSSSIRLFADDCVLYRPIQSQADAVQLQQDLTSLEQWSNTWKMSFNASKCYKMSVSRKQHPYGADYFINNKKLTDVFHNPYLGVELQADLKWDHHIHNSSTKANKVLGFLRRNLFACPAKVKEQAYYALVRPHLEYASSAWDPYLGKDKAKLEMVQRRAARFICNEYTRKPGVVTGLYQNLQWQPLEHRRQVQRLVMFHKILNQTVAIPMPTYIIPVARTGRRQQVFIQMATTTDQYMNTYFPRTVTDWNSLTADMRALPLPQFKPAVSAYLAAPQQP